MDRLEELLKLKEEIEAEIEMLVNQEDEIIEEMTEDLLEELAESDRDTCIHCLVKEYMQRMYDIGYEDAMLDIEE